MTITSTRKVRAHSLGLFRRFLLRFKNNRTYRISIPKRTDFVLFRKRIADVKKVKAMRSKFAKRTRSPAILSVPNKPLFHLFRQFYHQKLTDYCSVYSGIKITQLPPKARKTFVIHVAATIKTANMISSICKHRC